MLGSGGFWSGAIATLSALIDQLALSGEYRDQAVAYAHRYLAVDRLDESIHRRLIELYAARGDRAAALRQYRQCAILLERELGVQPLPETVSLYEVVLKGRASRQAVGAAALWTTLPGPHAPLVGRAEALEELRRTCTRAAGGQGGMVLITGEAGIGKSRLLQHFAAQLPARAIVLVAAGQPGAQSLPYGLITQAMRSRLRIDAQSGCSPPASYRLSPVWVAEVARLLPELETGALARQERNCRVMRPACASSRALSASSGYDAGRRAGCSVLDICTGRTAPRSTAGLSRAALAACRCSSSALAQVMNAPAWPNAPRLDGWAT